MRNNAPVTTTEYLLSDNDTLLSTTDVKGRITYANEAFVRASGFDRDALIGEPHNIVRHPGMPAEAFADMWRTLQEGRSWVGLVKNRRANGDYYWVRANATPMLRNGKLVGYLSVRTKPTCAEVQTAEQLYRDFKANQARGRGLDRGLVVYRGWRRWKNALKLWKSATRVRGALVGVGLLLAGALQSVGLNEEQASILYATLAVGLLLVDWFIEAQITTPLQQIKTMAQRVASGQAGEHLPLDRGDNVGQIARAVNQAGLNLQALLGDVMEQMTAVKKTETKFQGPVRICLRALKSVLLACARPQPPWSSKHTVCVRIWTRLNKRVSWPTARAL